MKLRVKFLLSAASLAAIFSLIVGAAWEPTGGSEHDVPVISALSPNAAEAGSPGFTLTASGAYFARDCVVRWSGSARPTVFVNETALRARIPASDLVRPGSADVTVVNPAFSRVSNVVTFQIAPVNSFQP